MTTGISPLPPITVQVGLSSNPLTVPQTWTDISSYVRKIDIQRGRQHVLNHFEPGRLTLLLNNRDRRFDPLNTAGPYYGNLGINKQVQVLANWNLLTAAEGGSTITSGWTGTNCSLTYPAGTLTLSSTASGNMSASTPTGSSGFAVVANQVYSGHASFEAGASSATRSCNVELLMYSANGTVVASSTGSNITDSASSYQQATVSPLVAPSNAAFAALEVNVLSTGAANEVHKVQSAGVYPAAGVTQFEPGGPQPIYTGFIDSIAQLWPDNVNNDVQISATDGMRLLAADTLGSGAYQGQCTVVDSAVHFWPLNEGSGSIALDYGSSPVNGTYAGNITHGLSSTNPLTADTVNLYSAITPAGYMSASSTTPSGSSQPWTMECWFNSSASSSGATIYVQGSYSGHGVAPLLVAAYTVTLGAGTGFLTVAAGTNNGAVDPISFTGSTNFADGNWHLLDLTRASDGKTWTAYVDTVSQGSAAMASSHDMSAAGEFSYDGLLNNTAGTPLSGNIELAYGAFYKSVLSSTQMSNHLNLGKNGWLQQDSGARITAALNAAGWPSSWENINTGDSILSVPTAPLTSTSVLSYAQLCETSEHGNFFCNAAGTLTFIHRTALLQSPYNTSQGTFGDNIASPQVEVMYGKTPDYQLDNIDLYNSSTCQTTTGVAQTATGSSISIFGMTNTLVETGLLFLADTEALNRAQWNVAHFQNPTSRVRSIVVDPLGDPAARFGQCIYRELLDQVTWNRRPYSTTAGYTGTELTQAYNIEGIDHSIDLTSIGTWKTTYHLYPTDTGQYWILGDSTFGVLDSTTRLAY